jgi:predicted phosphodiesterase
MKIQLVSDTHLEMRTSYLEKFVDDMSAGSDADVLVMAGDICSLKSSVQLGIAIGLLHTRYKHIVYVFGNHEFGGTSPLIAQSNANKITLQYPNFHVLDNAAVILDGQRFVGGTGWYPKQSDNFLYEFGMYDFKYIKDFDPWVYAQNRLFNDSMRIVEPDDIVVMHHLPTEYSIHHRFANNQLNRFFLCDISEAIEAKRPKYVLHGHTHEDCDYYIYHTKVYAAPCGYPSERQAVSGTFYKGLTFETP